MDREFLGKAMADRNPRGDQVMIGPSEVGGCRRRFWMRVTGQPKVNETLGLASWMGTAIHEKMAQGVKYQDPFGERFLIEAEATAVVGVPMTGHVDLFDMANGEVIDWKTTTKKKLSAFPSEQQRWQVHLYGRLLSETGHVVHTVTLVGIPRDGDERDIKIHSEPYDPEIVAEAVAWAEEVAGCSEPPEPEESVFFCRNYCSYFDEEGMAGCPGKK